MLSASRVDSIVGVSDNPTIELDSTSGSGVNHAASKEDLSGFVVEHDDHEEGHGGDGEVREGDHAGSEHSVEEGNVTEDGDESGLEEQSEVGVTVDHALLRDREVSSLADHEIGPLDADNRDEVTTLSVVESLNGVTDLVGGDVGSLVEMRDFIVESPSASGPFTRFTVSEEETHIESTLTGSQHVEDFTFTVFGPVGVSFALWIFERLVNVRVKREEALLAGESEESLWLETVIVHDVEVGEESGGGLDDTDLEVGE